eukprot:CAMPEP_0178796394 /NCGR_PEP_ID=MMETSP0745-20121128/10638_1 /TAXON_ID=913974 /ORGANISM="Nitzschia punctata, Strain CCMP561" /LENGTH=126 /DNA_ID=CAMNT_0020454855 /DNA_START=100 /DNA_END=480 /DNA_ORIENTATION=+
MASMLMFRLKERLPIKNKKVFWNDLRLARKIYRNLAMIPEAPSGVRNIGRRVSTFVHSTFGGHVGASTTLDTADNIFDIPHGTDDPPIENDDEPTKPDKDACAPLPPLLEETKSDLINAQQKSDQV